MTRWILGAAAALAILFPSTCDAQTTIIEPIGSRFPYQQWVDEAEVPTPDVTIEVIRSEPGHGCPSREVNYAGCTSPAEHKIWLDEAEMDAFPRGTFFHELGHNFDADEMPEWAREQFDTIYAFGGPWLVLAEPEPWSPGEWFAEAYSECAVKPYITKAETTSLGFAPVYQREPLFGRRQAHNRACRLIEAVGG